MNDQPTKAEVLETYRILWYGINSFQMCDKLTYIKDAYLAQGEELERLRAELKVAISGIDDCWDGTYLENGELFTTTICKKYGWDVKEMGR